MWRISLILIILCAFAGAGFWNAKSKMASAPSRLPVPQTHYTSHESKVTVVVARVPIKKGELFYGFNLELVDVDPSKVGQSDILSSFVLHNRRAKYDLPGGARITYDDINDQDKCLWTNYDRLMFAEAPAKPGFRWAIYPLSDVIPGEQVSPLKIGMKLIDEKKVPSDAIRCGTEVIGRTAPNGIAQGEIITEHNLSQTKHQ